MSRALIDGMELACMRLCEFSDVGVRREKCDYRFLTDLGERCARTIQSTHNWNSIPFPGLHTREKGRSGIFLLPAKSEKLED